MFEVAKKMAEVLKECHVSYLFIGKFAAILYGYPGTTQDIDIFPAKETSNCESLAEALEKLGFDLDNPLRQAILNGKDFIQIRGGPFPLDIIFAPDGIESFESARERGSLLEGIFSLASLEDIIQSKRAAGRQRDKEEVPRLERFKEESGKR